MRVRIPQWAGALTEDVQVCVGTAGAVPTRCLDSSMNCGKRVSYALSKTALMRSAEETGEYSSRVFRTESLVCLRLVGHRMRTRSHQSGVS